MKIKNVILLIVSVVLITAFSISASASESSIGIIGGADGPTAIMVSGDFPTFLFIALAIAVISLVIVSIILIKRRRKNK